MSTRMQFEPQKTLAFGGIGAAYAPVGTPLVNPSRQFVVQNLTNATLQFSFDGVNDHFPLISNAAYDSDNTSNRAGTENFFSLAAGTTLYVKNIGAPGAGAVYFSSIYSPD